MKAHAVARANHQAYDKIVVFFMSDGVPDSYPTAALARWQAEEEDIISKVDFVSVFFGSATEATKDLRKLADAFNSFGAAEAFLATCPTAHDIV